MKKRLRKQQVLEALESGPMTSADLAAHLGTSIQLASAWFSRLQKDGAVEKTGRFAPQITSKCPTCGRCMGYKRAEFWRLKR